MDSILSTLSAMALAASGQAQIYPVTAFNAASGERLTGTAKSTLQGGSFTMVSAAGVTCTGLYDVEIVSDEQTVVETQGGVQCDDGRSGSWYTAGTLAGGRGTAEIRSETFEVLFGDLAKPAGQ